MRGIVNIITIINRRKTRDKIVFATFEEIQVTPNLKDFISYNARR